jgi:hypothetical protein
MKSIHGVICMLCACIVMAVAVPATARRSGGGGGGGGGGTTFAGNWAGTISTSFGTGALTMKLSQSATALSGNVHFGAPIFDSTLKLAANGTQSQFSGFVSTGEGRLPITGTLSADRSTIVGTVTQGETYTYVVSRQ